MKQFHLTICARNVFYCLGASLTIALINSVPCLIKIKHFNPAFSATNKTMFNRLATSAQQSLHKEGKATNQRGNLCDVSTCHVIYLSGNVQKASALCGLTLHDV